MTEEFDPIAYIRDVRAHPENYVTVAECVTAATTLRSIRLSPDMKTLKQRFTEAARSAKDSGDDELLLLFTQAKDGRKAELAVP